MKRSKEEVDEFTFCKMGPLYRTAQIRRDAKTIKGAEFPSWYASLSETDKELYKEILFELSNI